MCIDNPLTTNERLTFLTYALQQTHPSLPLIQYKHNVHESSSRVKHHRTPWQTERTAETIAAAPSSCRPSSSSLFFFQHLSHDSSGLSWNEPLFPTGWVQPRVENGNANPPALFEPLRRTLFILVRVGFSPSGWQVRNNSAFRPGSWPCLTHLISDSFLFFSYRFLCLFLQEQNTASQPSWRQCTPHTF